MLYILVHIYRYCIDNMLLILDMLLQIYNRFRGRNDEEGWFSGCIRADFRMPEAPSEGAQGMVEARLVARCAGRQLRFMMI